jgi:hypothetical protein
MKTATKLLGFSVVASAILAGCTGTGLPSGTTPGAGKPGFLVRVTKDNQPVSGKTVFLKKFNNVKEGDFGNSDKVSGSGVKTDSNGNAFVEAPADAVTGGALFGVGYDAANTDFGGDSKNVAVSNLKDEIQWFTTPAVDLSTKTGKTASVNFDLKWATSGFTPADGGAVQGPKVTFQLTPKTGATKYEVVVNKGNVAGSGTSAAAGGSLTSSTTSITWDNATAGDYTYQAKAFTTSGVAGVTDQQASPWLVFKVTGAQ